MSDVGVGEEFVGHRILPESRPGNPGRSRRHALARKAAVRQETEDDGHEHQGGDGGEDQAAHDGTTERGVLLAALAKSKRHGRHANDHGKRSHQYWAEAGEEAGLGRGA